jgi:hypothetical protein
VSIGFPVRSSGEELLQIPLARARRVEEVVNAS